jgi:KDO2-lipid IV(A) lauroyltransferase
LNTGLVFGLTVFLVRRLPKAMSYAIGHVCCWIAWRLMPQTNDAVAHNLEAVMPSATVAARRRLALDVYRSYARDTIDFLRALALPLDRAREMFEVSPDVVARFEALRAEGRGIILVTGHYGNWELGSLTVRMLDLPLTVVAMAEASVAVNSIRREMRERLGIETLEVRRSLDTALKLRRTLADNRVLALLMDRHLDRDRIPVELLGRRAWFLRTPALMAYMTGAPLLPCFIERIGPERFRISNEEPIRVSRDGDREANLRAAAQQMADALSARVRAHPELWYHFYRYWDAQRDEYGDLV